MADRKPLSTMQPTASSSKPVARLVSKRSLQGKSVAAPFKRPRSSAGSQPQAPSGSLIPSTTQQQPSQGSQQPQSAAPVNGKPQSQVTAAPRPPPANSVQPGPGTSIPPEALYNQPSPTSQSQQQLAVHSQAVAVRPQGTFTAAATPDAGADCGGAEAACTGRDGVLQAADCPDGMVSVQGPAVSAWPDNTHASSPVGMHSWQQTGTTPVDPVPSVTPVGSQPGAVCVKNNAQPVCQRTGDACSQHSMPGSNQPQATLNQPLATAAGQSPATLNGQPPSQQTRRQPDGSATLGSQSQPVLPTPMPYGPQQQRGEMPTAHPQPAGPQGTAIATVAGNQQWQHVHQPPGDTSGQQHGPGQRQQHQDHGQHQQPQQAQQQLAQRTSSQQGAGVVSSLTAPHVSSAARSHNTNGHAGPQWQQSGGQHHPPQHHSMQLPHGGVAPSVPPNHSWQGTLDPASHPGFGPGQSCLPAAPPAASGLRDIHQSQSAAMLTAAMPPVPCMPASSSIHTTSWHEKDRAARRSQPATHPVHASQPLQQQQQQQQEPHVTRQGRTQGDAVVRTRSENAQPGVWSRQGPQWHLTGGPEGSQKGSQGVRQTWNPVSSQGPSAQPPQTHGSQVLDGSHGQQMQAPQAQGLWAPVGSQAQPGAGRWSHTTGPHLNVQQQQLAGCTQLQQQHSAAHLSQQHKWPPSHPQPHLHQPASQLHQAGTHHPAPVPGWSQPQAPSSLAPPPGSQHGQHMTAGSLQGGQQVGQQTPGLRTDIQRLTSAPHRTPQGVVPAVGTAIQPPRTSPPADAIGCVPLSSGQPAATHGTAAMHLGSTVSLPYSSSQQTPLTASGVGVNTNAYPAATPHFVLHPTAMQPYSQSTPHTIPAPIPLSALQQPPRAPGSAGPRTQPPRTGSSGAHTQPRRGGSSGARTSHNNLVSEAVDARDMQCFFHLGKWLLRPKRKRPSNPGAEGPPSAPQQQQQLCPAAAAPNRNPPQAANIMFAQRNLHVDAQRAPDAIMQCAHAQCSTPATPTATTAAGSPHITGPQDPWPPQQYSYPAAAAHPPNPATAVATSAGARSLSTASGTAAGGILQHTASPSSTSVPTRGGGLKLQLSDWIPNEQVVAAYADKGVRQLYPWQAGALECGVAGNNLVYCAPTSGGKSLVAEVLMVRQLLKHRVSGHGASKVTARALVVLPYISIVSEKKEHLQKVLASLKGTVKGYEGEVESSPLSDPDEIVAVCTMEKANVAVNHMIQQRRLHELVSVVIDEAHMVADPSRGLALELLLTKLMHYRSMEQAVLRTQLPPVTAHPSMRAPQAAAAGSPQQGPHLQIVAMSATMGGLEDMRAWLDAALSITNYRPVPLTEHVVFKKTVYKKMSKVEIEQAKSAAVDASAGKAVAGSQAGDNALQPPPAPPTAAGSQAGGTALQPPPAPSTAVSLEPPPTRPGQPQQVSVVVKEDRTLPMLDKDPDGTVALVSEMVELRQGVLVFCASRNACEQCALLLAAELPNCLTNNPWTQDTLDARKAIVTELTEYLEPGIKDPPLHKCLAQGVAWHHAGLSAMERRAVELAYLAGHVLVVCCTSTLAAGVNLPAHRVILRGTCHGGQGMLSRATYLQMVGRAGRAGLCKAGESFLIGQGAAGDLRNQWKTINEFLQEPLPRLKSCLLKRADGNVLVRPATASARAPAAPSDTQVALTQVAAPGGAAGASSQQGMEAGGKLTAAGCAVVEAGGKLTAAGCAAMDLPDEMQLQSVLLEAISNGSVSCEASMFNLLRSTLVYQQESWPRLRQAMFTAIDNLQQAGLVRVLPAEDRSLTLTHTEAGLPQLADSQPAQPRGRHSAAGTVQCRVRLPRRAEPTEMGSAVFSSSLPLHLGLALYKRLQEVMVAGLNLQAGPLHAICVVLGTGLEAFTIGNWWEWSRHLGSLPDASRQVAGLYGVTRDSADLVHCSRRQPSPQALQQHARVAAALCLSAFICEGSYEELSHTWGPESPILKTGLTRGMLQSLRQLLAQQAGMAAKLCASAPSMWQMEMHLTALSQQASAGARPELFRLMEVPTLKETPAYARSLFDHGIHDPSELAVASDSLVQRAVLAALPKAMKSKQPQSGSKTQKGTAALLVNHDSELGRVGLANRITRAIMLEAKQQALDSALIMIQDAQSLPDNLDDMDTAITAHMLHGSPPSSGSDQAPPSMGLRQAAHALEHATKRAQAGCIHRQVQGRAHVRCVQWDAAQEVVQRADKDLRSCLRAAFAFVWANTGVQTAETCQVPAAGQPHGLETSSSGNHACLGLVVAWSERDAIWIRCESEGVTSAPGHEAHPMHRHPLWPTILWLLTAPHVTKCCFSAVSHLATLIALDTPVHAWSHSQPPAPAPSQTSRPTLLGSVTASSQTPNSTSGTIAPPPAAEFLDPQLLHWLLGGAAAAVDELSAKDITDTHLPLYRLSVPVACGPAAVRAAADTCLRVYNACTALEAMAHSAGLLQWYASVELPVLISMAYTKAAQLSHAAWDTKGSKDHQPLLTSLGNTATAGADQRCTRSTAGALGPQPHLPTVVSQTSLSARMVQQVPARVNELRRTLLLLLPAGVALQDTDDLSYIHSTSRHFQLQPTATGQSMLGALQAVRASAQGPAAKPKDAAANSVVALQDAYLVADLLPYTGSDPLQQYTLQPAPLFTSHRSNTAGPLHQQIRGQVAWALSQMVGLLHWLCVTWGMRATPSGSVASDTCMADMQQDCTPGLQGSHAFPAPGSAVGRYGSIYSGSQAGLAQSVTDIVLHPEQADSVQEVLATLGRTGSQPLQQTVRQQLCQRLVVFDAEQAQVASAAQLCQAGLSLAGAKEGGDSAMVPIVPADQIPMVCMQAGCTALCSGTLLGLLQPPHSPPEPCDVSAGSCYTAIVAVRQAGPATLPSHVWAVPADSVWLHADVSRLGVQEAQADQGTYHRLLQVQVPLPCPDTAWRVPCFVSDWSLLHIRLPFLQLQVMAALSRDGVLLAASAQPDPLSVLAAAWERTVDSAHDGQHSQPQQQQQHMEEREQPPLEHIDCDPDQQQKAPAATATSTRLQQLLTFCAHVPEQQRTTWAVQQLLCSFLLGEGARKLCRRFEARGSQVPRMVAYRLLDSFLACLPEVKVWQDALLKTALDSAGRVRTVSGRPLKLEPVAAALGQRKHVKEALPTRTVNTLKRLLVREVVAGSVADVMRCVTAAAFTASVNTAPESGARLSSSQATQDRTVHPRSMHGRQDQPMQSCTLPDSVCSGAAQIGASQGAAGSVNAIPQDQQNPRQQQHMPSVVWVDSRPGALTFMVAQGRGAGPAGTRTATETQHTSHCHNAVRDLNSVAHPPHSIQGQDLIGCDGARLRGSWLESRGDWKLQLPDTAVVSSVCSAITNTSARLLGLSQPLRFEMAWGDSYDISQCLPLRPGML